MKSHGGFILSIHLNWYPAPFICDAYFNAFIKNVRVKRNLCKFHYNHSFLIYFSDSAQGPHEKRLLNDLLASYNILERPVSNESEPLLISFGLTLQQIIDVVSELLC